MSGFLRFRALFMMFVLLGTTCFCGTSADVMQYDYLKVPANEFLSSVKTVIEGTRQVISVLSKLGGFLGDFRVRNAVSDCVDLMDFSSDALNRSASVSQNPSGKDEGTGDVSFDLRTWLSAALSNQETCFEGFDGTNTVAKTLVAGSLNQVYSKLRDLLPLVQSEPKPKPKTVSKGPGKPPSTSDNHNRSFPNWVRSDDRKLLQANGVSADVIVAQDGTGKFSKIMDAVNAAPDNSTRRFVIYIKKGVYFENVEINKKKSNLMMIGDGVDVTVISGNRSFVDGWTTFRSATFAVSGRRFIARDITFENTAGPEKHQAVALRSDSDLSVFYRCAIRGYQDTLYTHTMRQFYRECIITGTVDFIFGDAAVVFQNCQILARQGLPNQKNTITAQGRKDPNQPTGFSIQFSNISADADLLPRLNTTRTYLGRPWKEYSRTVFLQSYMSGVVRPEGWLEWNGDFGLDTLVYGEYMNYGPGAGTANRVKWPGFWLFNDSAQASNFTVTQFIKGNLWIPSAGVRFAVGLDAV